MMWNPFELDAFQLIVIALLIVMIWAMRKISDQLDAILNETMNVLSVLEHKNSEIDEQ